MYIFWPCCVACGILVPQPGSEPTAPALETWGLNHWTAREVPSYVFSFERISSKKKKNDDIDFELNYIIYEDVKL